MKAKALALKLSKNIQNIVIDKHTLVYQPFLEIPPNTKSEVPTSHHSFFLVEGKRREREVGRIEQKSHFTFDFLKKQLKKYIYLKSKKHNILQKRKESPSEEKGGGRAQVIFLSIKGENINNYPEDCFQVHIQLAAAKQ